MSKTIKLKQTDLETLIQKVLSESMEMEEVEGGGNGAEVILAINPDTKEVYVVKDPDSDYPEIVGTGVKSPV